ncbi:hypothetical protein FOL47_009079 [Perkinsus chesapeaki]|uniref:Uncharacterized protein n=1 Tax=Perkinsus chesapeaki TaxID=330153 RepID=A0A7J6MSJ3_PERCH|nr:hypothetical protein FOL47_009079 [Perkinsus chesapeaki]
MPPPPPTHGKGGDGDFWTKLNRRRQFTDESAEVWETRGSSSHADAVYQARGVPALHTPTKVSDRIARFSSVTSNTKPTLVQSSPRTKTATISRKMEQTPELSVHEASPVGSEVPSCDSPPTTSSISTPNRESDVTGIESAPSTLLIRIGSSVSLESDELSEDRASEVRSPLAGGNNAELFPNFTQLKSERPKSRQHLQSEILRLRQELKRSRQKIQDLEERQKAFWEEDVFDIVNKMSAQRKSSLEEEADMGSSCKTIKSLWPAADSSVPRGTSIGSCSSVCSFHTAVSSAHWSDEGNILGEWEEGEDADRQPDGADVY